jgi:hypothetical protein
MLLVPFGIFGAAVFAEPTITQIKEVVCLIQESEDRSQESEVRAQKVQQPTCFLLLTPDFSPVIAEKFRV